MCNIDTRVQAILDAAFTTFQAQLEYLQRSNFTAYEFARTLPKGEVERRDASLWLQDKFNHGGMIGWATTITKQGGPVLYFRVTPSSPAGKRVERINADIATQEKRMLEKINVVVSDALDEDAVPA
jgi:hypothetical protein